MEQLNGKSKRGDLIQSKYTYKDIFYVVEKYKKPYYYCHLQGNKKHCSMIHENNIIQYNLYQMNMFDYYLVGNNIDAN